MEVQCMIGLVSDTRASEGGFAINGGSVAMIPLPGRVDDTQVRFWWLRARFDAVAEELLLLREQRTDLPGQARLSKEIIAMTLETMDLAAAGSQRSTGCLATSPLGHRHSPLASGGISALL
jgi:hypothetical protein